MEYMNQHIQRRKDEDQVGCVDTPSAESQDRRAQNNRSVGKHTQRCLYDQSFRIGKRWPLGKRHAQGWRTSSGMVPSLVEVQV